MSLAMRCLAALVILGCGTLASLSTDHSRHNYCLVGAGPGGIQLGHFFSASRSPELNDYGAVSCVHLALISVFFAVILERTATAGYFFRKCTPRSP